MTKAWAARAWDGFVGGISGPGNQREKWLVRILYGPRSKATKQGSSQLKSAGLWVFRLLSQSLARQLVHCWSQVWTYGLVSSGTMLLGMFPLKEIGIFFTLQGSRLYVRWDCNLEGFSLQVPRQNLVWEAGTGKRTGDWTKDCTLVLPHGGSYTWDSLSHSTQSYCLHIFIKYPGIVNILHPCTFNR